MHDTQAEPARMVHRVPSSNGAILVLGGWAETGEKLYDNHWTSMIFGFPSFKNPTKNRC